MFKISRLFSLLIVAWCLCCGAVFSAPIDDALKLSNEKSWELAREKFDAIAADEKETSFTRRKARLNSIYTRMSQFPNLYEDSMTSGLQQIYDEDPDGRLAPFALCHLATLKGRGSNLWDDAQTTVVLQSWSRACEAMERIAPDSMGTVLSAIVQDPYLSQRIYSSSAAADLVLWAYDRTVENLSPIDKDVGAKWVVAGIAKRFELKRISVEEMVRQYKTVAVEFRGEKGGCLALEALMNHFRGTNDLVQALKYADEILAQYPDGESSKKAKDLREEILKQEAVMNIDRSVRPGETYMMYFAWRNVDTLKLKIIPFDLMGKIRSDKKMPNPASIRGAAVWEKTFQGDAAALKEYKPTSTTVELKFDKPGTFAVLAESSEGKIVGASMLSVSALIAVRGASSNNSYQDVFYSMSKSGTVGSNALWAVDASTGLPRQGAQVVAVWVHSEGPRKTTTYTLQEIMTDANGFADLSKLAEGAGSGNYCQLFAAYGGSVAMLDSVYMDSSAGSRVNTKAYIYQDRPVYKPGETVYIKAVIRDLNNGVYVLRDSKCAYTMTVRNPKYETSATFNDLKADEFGTVHAEFKLPENAPLGLYSAVVEGIATAHFAVEEYRKPEYEVKVKMPSGAVKENTTVTVTVDSRYYHGAPVANADVSYTVRRQPRWWNPMSYWRSCSWSWFQSEQQDEALNRRNNYGDIVAKGAGKTGSDGKFELSFLGKLTPRSPEPSSYRYWWMPWNFSRMDDFVVEVSVMDASRRSIDGAGRITVGEKAMNVSVMTERRIVAPGDMFTADVKTENLSGGPLPAKGTVYIEKLEWNEQSKADTVTTLTSMALNVESSGTAKLSWRVEQKEAARLRAVYITKDEFGSEVSGACLFTVADANASDLLIKYQGIEASTDRDLYEVGDTAKILVTSEFQDVTTWWYLEGAGGTVDSRLQPLKKRTNLFELPVTEQMVPNCKLTLIAVKNGHVFQSELKLTVPPTRQVLTVGLTTDKAEYSTGEKAKLNLSVTDWQGKPVRGEFSLSVYDKSIEYIASDLRQDIRKYFYGNQKHLYRTVQWSGLIPVRQEWSWRESIPMSMDGRYEVSSKAVARGGRMLASGVVPAAAMAMEQTMTKDSAGDLFFSKEAAAPTLNEVRLREDFRDSALWLPVLKTDENGKAQAEVTWPDSLTTWKAVCVGISDTSLVGEASAETKVTKKLMVRLANPPFLRERDHAVVSTIVNNYLQTTQTVTVQLDAENVKPAEASDTRKVEVAPNGEVRLDWKFAVEKGAGEAVFTAKAVSADASDGMKRTVPLLPYGSDQLVGQSGMTEVRGEGHAETSVTIPAERIRRTTRLTVQVQPSVAMALRDALPSLIDYPYGCVEQTMNRFVPAAVAAHAFSELKIPEDPALAAKLPAVIRAGTERLSDMQCSDGGWGWWKSDTSDPYMTAVVLEGLSIARMNDLKVDQQMFDRGAECLEKLLKEQSKYFDKDTALDHWAGTRLAYSAYVLTLTGRALPQKVTDVLQRERNKLAPGALAMLAVMHSRAGRAEEAAVCLRNMQNFAVKTPENGAVHWGKDSGWFMWWDDPVESTARALRAYLEIEPDNELATGAMRWLVMNRRGCDWKNTKVTGQAVLALTEWMKKKNELSGEMKIVVQVGDTPAVTRTLTPADLWKFDGKIVLEGDAVPDGAVPVKISATGNGTLFWSVFAEYFTMEEKIPAAGYEAFVERVYERVSAVDGKDAGGNAVKREEFQPLKDGDVLMPGDEVRCTLRLRALNDFSYVVVEDPKPACLVPVEVRSGAGWHGLCSNTELRTAHTAFFIDGLKQGQSTLEYRLRAEMPGTFQSMPARVSAMYVPEVQGNSTNAVIAVKDKDR